MKTNCSPTLADAHSVGRVCLAGITSPTPRTPNANLAASGHRQSFNFPMGKAGSYTCRVVETARSWAQSKPALKLVLAFVCLCTPQSRAALSSNLDGQPPFGTNKHFAWSQNAGWLNLQPFGYTDDGVQVTSLTVSGIAWGQNIGWLKFGNGKPADGLRYSNNSGSDYGVNIDFHGNLSGYAWSQNAGWINFQWTGATSETQPRFNLTTHEFMGYAWSASLGWINLGGGWLKTDGPVAYFDSDQDGLPDDWERARSGNLATLNATTDSDGDGLPDGWEFQHFLGLDVSNGTQDSDDDGFSDATELAANSDPANPASPGPYPTPPTNSSINENDPYAWGQNIGWINARHNQPSGNNGVFLTAYHLRGMAWAQNAGWINFGDGTPRDGLRYSNTRADDCGVNIDLNYDLSGYAWGQNFGFINFDWASPTNPDRPRVDNSGSSRAFHGFAWSQNMGWINLSTLINSFIANAVDSDFDGLPDQWEYDLAGSMNVLDNTVDTDKDGLPDAWEFANFRSLAITNGSGDFDQDGVTDQEEFIASTNPRDALSLPPPPEGSIADSGKYAWSQNTGWINFRHNRPVAPGGVTVREYFLDGRAWGQNIGWLDLGDGTPADGIRYSNTVNTDIGVNHDGAGNLSGWAWSQNAGYINFGWAAANHPQRPRVSLANGTFNGYAWGQNIGWINLATGLQTNAIAITDTDGDGIDDAWEREHFGNLTTANASSDFDKDGQSDLAEYIAGTAPNVQKDVFKALSESFNGGPQPTFTLTFPSSPTRQYSISASSDLASGWTVLPTPGWFGGSDTGYTTATVNVPGGAGDFYFFRVNARRPLTP